MHDAHPPRSAVRAAVVRALDEDLLPLGDLTAALVPPDVEAVARFVPRSDGVLAGVLCASEAFAQLDDRLVVRWSADDGDRLRAGVAFGQVEGPLGPLLTAERTALNFLCHLSGIATLTAAFCEAAAVGGSARVWDTRKTTPGLRTLEKAAVRAGGGSNHRGNLSEWVMLKDNHVALLGIGSAVRRARERWPGRLVHVEVTTLAELGEALEAGATAILLDNMSPDGASAAVQVIDRWVADGKGPRPLVECSGGITLDTAAAFAASGVDLLSTSQITQSAPALDIGLDVVDSGARHGGL